MNKATIDKGKVLKQFSAIGWYFPATRKYQKRELNFVSEKHKTNKGETKTVISSRYRIMLIIRRKLYHRLRILPSCTSP
jgi:hypothetical protein